MKVVWFSWLCAVAVAVGCADAGGVLSRSLLTLHPGQSYAYSTSTQYLNTLPLAYTYGLRPQLAYHYPQLSQVSAVSPIQAAYPGYYPVSYFPSNPVYYPPTTIDSAPAPGDASRFPPQPAPAPQPAGDADTSVVDAAQSGEQPQYQEDDSSKQQSPENQQAQFPPSTFPSFPPFLQQAGQQPSFPQFPQQTGQQPSFPQFPQQAGQQPSFPQFPQQTGQQPSFPQFPQQGGQQPSFPQLPQFPPQFPQGSIPSFPQFPQQPSSPPSSFPAADSGDRGLNDEDTISVESARK